MRGSVSGAAARAHGEAEAERLATAALAALEIPTAAKELVGRGKWSNEKALVSALIRKRTGVPNSWIARRLEMGHEVSVTRAVRLVRESKVWTKRMNELESSLGL